MMFLTIALLYLTIVSGSIFDDNIFENTTPEDVRQIVHSDFVPTHEIVKVHLSERLHKRDLSVGTKMHIRAFGENISLWLYPSDSVLAGIDTPVYYAGSWANNPEKVEFMRWHGSMEMVDRLYTNLSWGASFIIGEEESGNVQVNGYIGSRRLVVRSLPTHVAEEYRRRRSVADDDDGDSPLHVVFQMNENIDEDLSLQSINVTALRENITESRNGSIPDTLYPEVLVVVEQSIQGFYGGDMYDIVRYVLAFMNGVDLKFRSIEDPKVRFHISGIVVGVDPEATPFISNNSMGTNVFNSHQAMYDATKFFYGVKDTFPLGSYDIALTMTRQDFGVNGSEIIMGQATIGAACRKSDDSKSVESVTIIKDNGAFNGVYIAAHEIGHLIGASHDGNSTGDNCLYSNGYLMSYTVRYTSNSSDFSTCSIDAIYDTLQTRQLDCLFNPPPSAGRKLRPFMPGRIKNLEEQCKSLNGTASCQNPNGSTDICVEIFCKDKDGRCVRTKTAAPDGTTCGDGKFCLHMKCVNL